MADSHRNDPAASLADALVADLLKLSDADLLRELVEDGINLDQDASAARATIAAALIRTTTGRSESSVEKSTESSGPRNRSMRSDRRFHDGLANDNNHMLANELTLAARNGSGISARELEDIVKDLLELGALGEGDC